MHLTWAENGFATGPSALSLTVHLSLCPQLPRQLGGQLPNTNTNGASAKVLRFEGLYHTPTTSLLVAADYQVDRRGRHQSVGDLTMDMLY